MWSKILYRSIQNNKETLLPTKNPGEACRSISRRMSVSCTSVSTFGSKAVGSTRYNCFNHQNEKNKKTPKSQPFSFAYQTLHLLAGALQRPQSGLPLIHLQRRVGLGRPRGVCGSTPSPGGRPEGNPNHWMVNACWKNACCKVIREKCAAESTATWVPC